MSCSTSAPQSEITFNDFGLIEPLLAALNTEGYTIPTPIQAAALEPLLKGRDVLGQAQTGTGKTAAFALPMLQRIDLDRREPQVLVLAPTRELAIQVSEAFERYGAGMRGLRVAAIYGGAGYHGQLQQLERGAHVIVGTPGRVMDHMRRGALQLDCLRGLVLDEADEMLRMGFIDDVEWVLTQSPAERQIALFSATMPDQIRRIAHKYLRNPHEITIKQRTATADTVQQRFVTVAPHQKQELLAQILEAEPTDAVLIFVRTKSMTEPLAEFLASRGRRTAALNGDVPQTRREKIIENLKDSKIDVIVATDVAARGLDVQRISHVINYDLPVDSESYVHRIGRTGRAGRAGAAILFLHPRERNMLRRIEQATRQSIEPMEIPTKRSINKRRVTAFHERITAALARPDLDSFASLVKQYLEENEAPIDQIAAALAALAAGDAPLLLKDELKLTTFDEPQVRSPNRRFEDDRRSGPGDSQRRGPRNDRPSRNGDERMETYRIEVGHNHQVKPANIVGLIANETGLDGFHIGRIEIFEDHSTVDLLAGMPEDVFHSLKQVALSGRPLNISRLADGATSQDRPMDRKFKSKGGKPKGSFKPKDKFKGKPKRAFAKA